MKKFVTPAVLALISLGLVAPAMAWDQQNCPFRDKSMCIVNALHED
jgi:hypothetical protein